MPTASHPKAMHRPQHSTDTTPPDSAAPTATPVERLLRVDDVCHQTGLGRSTVYSKVKAGDMPAPVRLHGATVAWLQSEIQAWIVARPRAAMPEAAPRRRRAAAQSEA